MTNRFCFTLRLKPTLRSAQTKKKVNSKYFKPFGSFSPSFWAGQGVASIRIARNDKNVTCSRVQDSFYFAL